MMSNPPSALLQCHGTESQPQATIPMERAAFAHARRFLNYHPLAKWSAVLAAVGTGILFVALLIVLALFTDLMVNRGEIPCYSHLPPPEKHHFLTRERPPERLEAIQEELAALGLAPLAAKDLELHAELWWYAELPLLVEQAVGADAARLVRQSRAEQIRTLGLQAAVYQNLKDLGILSLVVRNQSGPLGTLVGFL